MPDNPIPIVVDLDRGTCLRSFAIRKKRDLHFFAVIENDGLPAKQGVSP